MNTKSTDPSSVPVPARRAARAARSERGQEFLVEDFLGRRRVSELQEMWAFWHNGGKTPARKGDLLGQLTSAMRDDTVVRERIKVLSDRVREVLLRLVRADGYTARLRQLLALDGGAHLEGYEVEAAARALAKRGFLQVTRVQTASRGVQERYTVPRDLGDLIAALLREERRGPREVFSLTGFLASLPDLGRARVLDGAAASLPPGSTPAVQCEALLVFRAADPFGATPDDALREALRRTALEHGGIVTRERFDALLAALHRPDGRALRGLLEEKGLGTVTHLAMAEYGVERGAESVVLFAEVTERALDAARPAVTVDHDRVDSARVDLLTDLQQFLHLVTTTPLRVTQGRSIYRAAQHRILDSFIFNEDALMDRSRMFDLVYDLAFGLELVEVGEDSRLRLTRKGEAWDTEDLTEKVRAIYGRFLEERLPEGRDFHVRRLRRAVAAALAEAPAGRFLPRDDVPFRVRNDYLAALDEQGIREQYRNRFQYTYTPPRATPEDLRRELVDYVLSRLYPLGAVDVALNGDEAVALRLTELGRRLLQGEKLGSATLEVDVATVPCTAKPLVVNPDYEVILFPEGDVNEVAHRLNRFASRTKSDEVAHYRITRDGVERAVVKGMDAAEILDFLDAHSRVPVPQNVAYSVREWAARVGFAQQRDVVLLTTNDADAMERVLGLEDVRRLLAERLSPTAVVLRARITDWKVLETLRALGVYFS